jgi:hypothetical protein
MVAGRTVTYPDRPRVIEGKRGEKCGEPGCDCGGWLDIDPEHSADMGGNPVLPWYAAFIHPGQYILTAHHATVQHEGRGHDVLLINGGKLTAPPLKVILISGPGTGRIWRRLTGDEAREHATAALAAIEGNDHANRG